MKDRNNYSAIEQENNLLWTINSISFDTTFVYYVDRNSASVRHYVEGTVGNSNEISDFTGYLLEKVHPDDLSLLEKEIIHASRLDENIRFEIRFREAEGRRYRWHSVRMRLVSKEGDPVYVGSTNYIDNRKNKESMLTIKARQDTFTGLLNKVATVENINAFIKQHPNNDSVMILFDVDNFKHFNDSLGHLFGDEVIKEVANRLSRAFAHDSFVGRIGGDEFLVFVKNTVDMADVIARVEALKASFADITLGQKSNVNVSCSVGISIYPDMGSDFDSLFRACDMALYYVKNSGKNNYAIYTDELYNEAASEEEDNPIDNFDGLTITNFAFKLLNEAEDVNGAINLLLYKMQREYHIDAIYVYELDATGLATECLYESVMGEFPSKLGEVVEFSHKAWLESVKRADENGGFVTFNLKDPGTMKPGNGIEKYELASSMIQCPMNLFSKNHGTIDFVSRYGTSFWTERKCNELLSICNLITVCLYYSRRTLKAEQEALRATEFDMLTGLMKEDNFIDAATAIIGERGNTSKLAVIYCDISNFKYINEAYGYTVGDKILIDVADYISKNIKGVLCAGRFYSDNILCIKEFARSTPDERLVEMVDDINDLLSQYLSRKYSINGLNVHAGIYIIPDNKVDVLQSISNANMARKLAKSSKSGKCILFAPEMYEKRKRQIKYIQELDDAIKNEEFFVCLQPKVLGYEHRLVGAEALVRWRKPDGTMIFPDEFIPAFEKGGSIVKLDFYVYEKVMSYLRSRLDAGKKVLPVSMNVSRIHLQTPDFVKKFKSLVEKYNIPTEYLELELTESIYLENLASFNDTIEELRSLGIKISMDDFGSGYSSLNALNDLKIDLLKIDKIFMKDENLREGDKTIIRFIIEMAKNLSMQVLCEGVETDAQRKFLIEAGCDLHQGYLYSKPVEIAVFDRYIDNEEMLFAKIG
ncbi:MAG: GGDEF and EAL domain-containing protein [Lachnospiraceae bacterium]|nr:GGDEF and EAL domain-containing protein [Lachnospiraceae bacterium]